MAQVILKKCEKKENGIKLTFDDLEGNEITGIYNLDNLDLEQMQKLLGKQISYSEKEEGFHIHKAWDDKKPIYCDDPKHGFDR